MIRILLVFCVAIVVASVAAWLSTTPGQVTIIWRDWEVQTYGWVFMLAAFVAIYGLILLYRLYARLRRVPGLLRGGMKERRQRKGVNAAVQGLVAIAAGDSQSARKYVSQSEKWLGNEALAHFLNAQAAQLEGRPADAETHFRAMLDVPDTKILGLKGLLAQAQRDGDLPAALDYADQAFELRPKLDWPFESLFTLQCGQGDWTAALGTLDRGKKSGLRKPDPAKRQKAVLLCARAYSVAASDPQTAEADALKSHRLMPEFSPSAVLAAQLLKNRDQGWKASGVVEDAWRAAPHPALVAAYVQLQPDESASERAKRLAGLAEMRPSHMESQLLLARQAINTRDWEKARDVTTELAQSIPTSRVCALMAEIERGELGNVGGEREWLARAVAAPPEPDWIRLKFDFSAAEWADLVRQVGADDAVWPPAPDPAAYADDPNILAPFTPALQLLEADPPMDPPAEEVTEEVLPEPTADPEPDANTEPLAVDYETETVEAPAASPASDPEEKPRPTADTDIYHSSSALRSVRRGSDPVFRQKRGLGGLVYKGAGRKSFPGSLNVLPRQPDDPGPDYKDDQGNDL